MGLSLEIVWFRILDVAIKSSTYTFGHLLGLYLACLGLGSVAGAICVRRASCPDRLYFWGQWGACMSAAVAIALIGRLPTQTGPLVDLHRYWGAGWALRIGELVAMVKRDSQWPFDPSVALALRIYGTLPLVFMALPTFLMGFTYAPLQRLVQRELRRVGWRVAVIRPPTSSAASWEVC